VRVLLFDSNVLIDYFDAEPTVFASVARSVGEIYVVSTVLAEVGQIDESHATDLGLKIFVPDFATLSTAAVGGGKLSFQDKLCLAVARSEGMTCVTNDTALRTRCTEENVQILWGLELLLLAVEKGGLVAGEAREIGTKICDMNTRIGDSVLRDFLSKLT